MPAIPAPQITTSAVELVIMRTPFVLLLHEGVSLFGFLFLSTILDFALAPAAARYSNLFVPDFHPAGRKSGTKRRTVTAGQIQTPALRRWEGLGSDGAYIAAQA